MSREKQIDNCYDCIHYLACLRNGEYIPTPCDMHEDKAGYRKQSENTVEVVRCKDCEYWTEVSFDAITEWHWGECRKPLGDYRDCDTAEHDFCSYGEAKMKGGAE